MPRAVTPLRPAAGQGIGGLSKGEGHPAHLLSDPTLVCFLPRAGALGKWFRLAELLWAGGGGAVCPGLTGKLDAWDLAAAASQGARGLQ